MPEVRNPIRVVFLPQDGRVVDWLFDHPSRMSWVLLEFARNHLPWKRRLANAWFQLRRKGGFHA